MGKVINYIGVILCILGIAGIDGELYFGTGGTLSVCMLLMGAALLWLNA